MILPPDTARALGSTHLEGLIRRMHAEGYRVIGPTRQGDAIVYDDVADVGALPAGWSDDERPGACRLVKRETPAWFEAHGAAQSWRRFLQAPRRLVFRLRRGPDGPQLVATGAGESPWAFIGVRPCELAAIQIQDRVFLHGPFADPAYRNGRTRALVVAVNCTNSCGTGFCASMGTGPAARQGFDIVLSEIVDHGRHCLVAAPGSETGRRLLEALEAPPATEDDRRLVERALERAARAQRRSLDPDAAAEVLAGAHEHPRWDEVATRCLSCANCTLVCPTCFCSTVEDTTDLTGEYAERWNRWDSCFTTEFSYLHGGSVRASAKSRYRQWLRHKLSTWVDQFGTTGCVGCGRCITWCPVGIDLTEEVRALARPAPRRRS